MRISRTIQLSYKIHICRLTRLRSLDISGNDLRCLPPCLPRLTALTFLNLSYMPHLQVLPSFSCSYLKSQYTRRPKRLVHISCTCYWRWCYGCPSGKWYMTFYLHPILLSNPEGYIMTLIIRQLSMLRLKAVRIIFLQLEETDEVDAAPVYYNRARQKLGLCKIVMRHLPRLNNLLAHQNKQAPWSQESAKELEQVSECWHIQGIWSPDKKKTIAF